MGSAWGTANKYHEFLVEGDTIIDLEASSSGTELSDKFAAVNNTDWASVSTSNKNGSVYRTDPVTGEVATSKTSVYGTRISNSYQYYSYFMVTGVSHVSFYVGSGSSSRYAYLDVYSSDGMVGLYPAAISYFEKSGYTDVLSCELDKEKSYTLRVYASGDLFCYAAKFTAEKKCNTPPANPLVLSTDPTKIYEGDVVTFNTTGGNGKPVSICGTHYVTYDNYEHYEESDIITENAWTAIKGLHTFTAIQSSVGLICGGADTITIEVLSKSPVTRNTIMGDTYTRVGESIELTCETGENAVTYQWYRDGMMIPGATGRTYTFTPEQRGNFVFTCEASNEFTPTPLMSAEHTVHATIEEYTIEVTARSDRSSVHMAIGEAYLEDVRTLSISGTINSYDLMIMRNKMINLRELDLTNVSILANPYEYYTGYCSHADTLLANSFVNLTSLKLPLTLKYIANVSASSYLEINGGAVGNSISAFTVVINEGVTKVWPTAFKGNTTLRQITIDAPLTEISDDSFSGCTNLVEVVLPATLERIGNSAFRGTQIQKITIPANVKTIGSYAFAPQNSYSSSVYQYHYGSGYDYSTSRDVYNGIYAYRYEYKTKPLLTKLYFETNSKLETIGSYAFALCPIDTLIVPDSVSFIGEFAFYGCSNLKTVVFSEQSKLTSIKEGVFQSCSALNAISLPSFLQAIGQVAFLSAGTKQLDLVLPQSVTSIGAGAFYGCGMKSVLFPSTLKSIYPYSFCGCSSLTSISFPTSLQIIDDYAFYSCSGLQEIKVPSTLRHVGDYAFGNCNNVKKVYTYTVEPVSIDQNTFSCWKYADLYVPTTSYYNYYYNTQWSQFLSLKEFDEEYEYFYINNDYELGGETGTIDGNPDADLNENSGLIVTGDEEQGMGVITVMGDGENAGSIIACEENLKADSLIVRILTKKGQWNYFCFPFDILLDQLHFAHQFVVREYNGATRAQYGAGGWIDMIGDMIHSGLGYIFQGAQTDTLEIVIPNPKISCQDYEQVIQAFSSDDAVHANWNFIGNPYPSWYDLDFLFAGGFSSPVYIWNSNSQDYQVYKPGDDEYHFHPYEGFFTQNPGNAETHIIWGSDGRETKTQADEKQHGSHMPRKAARAARQQSNSRKLINLQLASEDYTDRARIVFNDAAQMGYELGKDAVVMDGGQAPLHIWSLNEGKRLSINERPYADGQVSLGYYVQENGFYTLAASRMDTAVIIFDNELGQEVDLSLGDYVFYTNAGTNNTRFSIVRIKSQTEQTTAIEDVVDAEETVSVYTVLGAKLLDNVRRADLRLNAGVYIIEKKNGARAEITIQ
jgi:hypothetical protein